MTRRHPTTDNNRDVVAVRLTPELLAAIKARKTRMGSRATLGQAVRALLFEATGIDPPENIRQVRAN